jgi:hypothetical protein
MGAGYYPLEPVMAIYEEVLNLPDLASNVSQAAYPMALE